MTEIQILQVVSLAQSLTIVLLTIATLTDRPLGTVVRGCYQSILRCLCKVRRGHKWHITPNGRWKYCRCSPRRYEVRP